MVDNGANETVRNNGQNGVKEATHMSSGLEFRQVVDGAVTTINTNAKRAEQMVGVDDPRVARLKKLTVQSENIAAGEKSKLKRLERPFKMSDELRQIVKVAQICENPLLLEGESGCGKTSLPYAVAAEMGVDLIHAQCKSTTTAQELLYTFDHLARMRDAQMGLDVSDTQKYLKLGPLGQAFTSTEPVVLVIDEADKAKRDFLNDLLNELDQAAFFITETGEQVAADVKPFIFITSNREKELPEAATRRCTYHYMEFPSPEYMSEIVKIHKVPVTDALLDQALEQFYELRAVGGLQKKPSTGEILNWLKVMSAFGIKELKGVAPHLETLIKNQTDLKLVIQHQREMEKTLKELGISRTDIEFLYEPGSKHEEITRKRRSNSIHKSVEGKDALGRVIIRLPDGTRFVKKVTTPEEEDNGNYSGGSVNEYISPTSIARISEGEGMDEIDDLITNDDGYQTDKDEGN